MNILSNFIRASKSHLSHWARRFSTSQELKGKQVVVISGGGMIARETALHALKDPKKYVFICSTKSSFWADPDLQKQANGRLKFKEVSYEQGNQSKVWNSLAKEIAKGHPASCTAINTRGVGVSSCEKALENTIKTPALAFATGFEEAFQKHPEIPHAFINCSSSVAAIKGFENPYAKIRRETDLELINTCSKGATLGIDYVLHDLPTNSGKIIQPNHAFSFLDILHLTKGIGQPIIGDPNVIAIQPIHSRQLSKITLNPKLLERDFSNLLAVGPKAYTQSQIYDVYADVMEKLGSPLKRKDRHLSSKTGGWMANHAPMGHIARYAIDLLEHRATHPETNHPHCHKAAEELAEEALLNMEETYREIDQLALVGRGHLVKEASKRIVGALVTSPRARSDALKLLFGRE